MRTTLLPLLACPKCAADLELSAPNGGDDVREGELRCKGCGAKTPITRGVPDFTDQPKEDLRARTADNFGYSWNAFAVQEANFDTQFLGWIEPATTGDFTGKLVFEAGCGMGRHTEFVARAGAKAIVGVDFSTAVYPAEERMRNFPNAHIIRADINALPLKRTFDVAFSVGVLHHLLDPKRGFHAMVSRVKPGGKVIAWVYGQENNGWITNVVTPLREKVLSKLPMGLLHGLAFGLTAGALFPALKLVYGPVSHSDALRPAQKYLFYPDYLGQISGYSFRHVRHIVFDHLLAPVAHYLPREEVQTWANEAALRNSTVRWHNKMSWTLVGTTPK